MHSQVDLASEQLNCALKLLLAKSPSFASSLTLAGAAEEIFGKALERQGKTNAIQHHFSGKNSSHSPRNPKQTWQEHVAEENFARNALKHLHARGIVDIPGGLEDAAAMMAYRAITNYEWLGLKKTWRMVKFERWFWKWAI